MSSSDNKLPHITPKKSHSIKPEWRWVIDEEMRKHGVSWMRVISTSRMPNIVKCRWTIWQRLRAEFGASYTDMAEQFDVHHTTILYALGRLGGKNPRGTVTPE